MKKQICSSIVAFLFAAVFMSGCAASFMNLMKSVDAGETEQARAMIRENPKMLTDENYGGMTALIYAAANGKLNAVKLLLQEGADINLASSGNGMTPLSYAVYKNQTEVVKYLLSKKANTELPDSVKGRTALQYAAASGCVEPLKLLLAAKASAKVRDYEGLSAAQLAVYYGEPDTLKVLMNAGYFDKQTLMSNAMVNMVNGDAAKAAAAVKALVPGNSLDQADFTGKTALIWAAITKSPQFVNVLITKGANVNAVDTLGRTALYWAAAKNEVNIARSLLAAGADVNPVEAQTKKTPLHVAVVNKNTEMVSVLLGSHPDFAMFDSNNKSALYYADINSDIQRMLKAAGARFMDYKDTLPTPTPVPQKRTQDNKEGKKRVYNK